MAWTNPTTWTAGQVVTAANLNTEVRDNLLYLYGVDNGLGAWTTVQFTTAFFTGDGDTTMAVNSTDVSTFQYYTLGNPAKTMHVEFFADTVSVNGSTGGYELRVAIPAGKTARRATHGICMIKNSSGAWEAGHVVASSGVAYLACYRGNAAAHTIGSSGTSLRFGVNVDITTA